MTTDAALNTFGHAAQRFERADTLARVMNALERRGALTPACIEAVEEVLAQPIAPVTPLEEE